METITDTPDTSTTQRPAGRAGQGQGGGRGRSLHNIGWHLACDRLWPVH